MGNMIRRDEILLQQILQTLENMVHIGAGELLKLRTGTLCPLTPAHVGLNTILEITRIEINEGGWEKSPFIKS